MDVDQPTAAGSPSTETHLILAELEEHRQNLPAPSDEVTIPQISVILYEDAVGKRQARLKRPSRKLSLAHYDALTIQRETARSGKLFDSRLQAQRWWLQLTVLR